jgi:hypothetical protein
MNFKALAKAWLQYNGFYETSDRSEQDVGSLAAQLKGCYEQGVADQLSREVLKAAKRAG